MMYKNFRRILASLLMVTFLGLALMPGVRAESIPVWPATDQYGNALYDTYGNSCVIDRYGYLYVMDSRYQLYPAGTYTCRVYLSSSGTTTGGGYNNYSYQDKSSEIANDFFRRQAESLKSTACMPYCNETDSYDGSSSYDSNSYDSSSYSSYDNNSYSSSSYDSDYDDGD